MYFKLFIIPLIDWVLSPVIPVSAHIIFITIKFVTAASSIMTTVFIISKIIFCTNFLLPVFSKNVNNTVITAITPIFPWYETTPRIAQNIAFA